MVNSITLSPETQKAIKERQEARSRLTAKEIAAEILQERRARRAKEFRKLFKIW